ncbi:MAG TPA: matrixin family metalloprotease [Anaeromyxobacteraceae bacterium]|nr:matrixin family metalloprotease [Anaeromyxobacteraceae bacterium]
MSRRLAGAAALLLWASPGDAWVRSTTGSGLCLWWSTRQVHYAVNDFAASPAASVCSSSPSPPGGAAAAIDAVRTSFTTWAGAGGCTDMQTVEDGTTSSTATGLDCRNLVVFRRGQCQDLVPPDDPCRLWDVDGSATVNCADKYNCWDGDDPSHGDSRVIALTTVSYDAGTGEIVDADMELNAWGGSGPSPPGFYFTCLDPPAATCGAPGQSGCISVDVRNVVTHEAGHVLGLGHSEVSAATMYPSALSGETAKRTLDPDDVAGLCAIYPSGQPTNVCYGSGQVAPRPSSTCERSSSCGCGTAGAEGWLGLLALLLWRRKARYPLWP